MPQTQSRPSSQPTHALPANARKSSHMQHVATSPGSLPSRKSSRLEQLRRTAWNAQRRKSANTLQHQRENESTDDIESMIESMIGSNHRSRQPSNFTQTPISEFVRTPNSVTERRGSAIHSGTWMQETPFDTPLHSALSFGIASPLSEGQSSPDLEDPSDADDEDSSIQPQTSLLDLKAERRSNRQASKEIEELEKVAEQSCRALCLEQAIDHSMLMYYQGRGSEMIGVLTNVTGWAQHLGLPELAGRAQLLKGMVLHELGDTANMDMILGDILPLIVKHGNDADCYQLRKLWPVYCKVVWEYMERRKDDHRADDIGNRMSDVDRKCREWCVKVSVYLETGFNPDEWPHPDLALEASSTIMGLETNPMIRNLGVQLQEAIEINEKLREEVDRLQADKVRYEAERVLFEKQTQLPLSTAISDGVYRPRSQEILSPRESSPAYESSPLWEQLMRNINDRSSKSWSELASGSGSSGGVAAPMDNLKHGPSRSTGRAARDSQKQLSTRPSGPARFSYSSFRRRPRSSRTQHPISAQRSSSRKQWCASPRAQEQGNRNSSKGSYGSTGSRQSFRRTSSRSSSLFRQFCPSALKLRKLDQNWRSTSASTSQDPRYNFAEVGYQQYPTDASSRSPVNPGTHSTHFAAEYPLDKDEDLRSDGSGWLPCHESSGRISSGLPFSLASVHDLLVVDDMTRNMKGKQQADIPINKSQRRPSEPVSPHTRPFPPSTVATSTHNFVDHTDLEKSHLDTRPKPTHDRKSSLSSPTSKLCLDPESLPLTDTPSPTKLKMSQQLLRHQEQRRQPLSSFDSPPTSPKNQDDNGEVSIVSHSPLASQPDTVKLPPNLVRQFNGHETPAKFDLSKPKTSTVVAPSDETMSTISDDTRASKGTQRHSAEINMTGPGDSSHSLPSQQALGKPDDPGSNGGGGVPTSIRKGVSSTLPFATSTSFPAISESRSVTVPNDSNGEHSSSTSKISQRPRLSAAAPEFAPRLHVSGLLPSRGHQLALQSTATRSNTLDTLKDFRPSSNRSPQLQTSSRDALQQGRRDSQPIVSSPLRSSSGLSDQSDGSRQFLHSQLEPTYKSRVQAEPGGKEIGSNAADTARTSLDKSSHSTGTRGFLTSPDWTDLKRKPLESTSKLAQALARPIRQEMAPQKLYNILVDANAAYTRWNYTRRHPNDSMMSEGPDGVDIEAIQDIRPDSLGQTAHTGSVQGDCTQTRNLHSEAAAQIHDFRHMAGKLPPATPEEMQNSQTFLDIISTQKNDGETSDLYGADNHGNSTDIIVRPAGEGLLKESSTGIRMEKRPSIYDKINDEYPPLMSDSPRMLRSSFPTSKDSVNGSHVRVRGVNGELPRKVSVHDFAVTTTDLAYGVGNQSAYVSPSLDRLPLSSRHHRSVTTIYAPLVEQAIAQNPDQTYNDIIAPSMPQQSGSSSRDTGRNDRYIARSANERQQRRDRISNKVEKEPAVIQDSASIDTPKHKSASSSPQAASPDPVKTWLDREHILEHKGTASGSRRRSTGNDDIIGGEVRTAWSREKTRRMLEGLSSDSDDQQDDNEASYAGSA